MSLGDILGIGGSLLGGIFGSHEASKAAKAQEEMGRQALALQEKMYEEGRTDLAPWRAAGGQAIGQGLAMLQPGYDYTASPGYQFRLGEGLRGVQNSAAARGLLQSGGTLKGIDQYSQGLAAQDFGDQFNREMAIAGGGQQAATSGAQLGANMAANGSQTLQGIGQARASGYAGQNAAMQGTLGNLMSLFGSGAFGGGGSSGGSGGGSADFGGGIGLSDRRLKTNIVKVGEASDGLGIYEWNWKAEPSGKPVRGVIADEVEKLRPWAFVPNFKGDYAGVNYAALGAL